MALFKLDHLRGFILVLSFSSMAMYRPSVTEPGFTEPFRSVADMVARAALLASSEFSEVLLYNLGLIV